MENTLKNIIRFRNLTKQSEITTPRILEFDESLSLNERLKKKFRLYYKAQEEEDVDKIAKSLAYLLTDTYNIVCEHGLQGYIDDILKEVHESNLSRLGANREVYLDPDGSIGKGPYFFKPEIADILKGKRVVRTRWYNFTTNKKYKEVMYDLASYSEEVLNSLDYKREKFTNNILKKSLKWYDFALFVLLKNTGLVSLKEYFADKVSITNTSNGVVISVYGVSYSMTNKKQTVELKKEQPKAVRIRREVSKKVEEVKPKPKKEYQPNSFISQVPKSPDRDKQVIVSDDGM